MPVVGQACDYFGRKWLMIILSSMGAVGPLVISRAQNMGTLMAGFILSGPALASQATTFAIASEIIPRQHRGLAQSAISMSMGIGGVISILMGGALLRNNELENYRIYWYVAATLYFIGCLGVAVGYRPPPRDLQLSLTTLQKLRKLDFLGLILIGGGLALFSIGLQWSVTSYSWTDPHVLGPFLVSIVLMIGFVVYSWLLRDDGFMDHKLFGDRNFPMALALIFLEGLSFFAANSYLAFEIGVLYRLDLLESGYRFAVLFVGSIVFAMVVGVYITYSKQVREPIVVGFVFFVLGFALFAAIDAHTEKWKTWISSLLVGTGLGFVLPTLYVTAHMSTPKGMISVTTSIASATRSFGGAVGVAVNNALFTHSFNKKLPQKVAAAVLPLGFPPSQLGMLIPALASGNEEAIRAVSGTTPQMLGAAGSALIDAYVGSFQKAWIAAAAFSAAGLTIALFLRNPKPDFNSHIDAPVEVRVAHHEHDERVVGAA
ncbi:major facilitator superfamily domain-containing protein [Cadophora sp. MPI-SDFR-AT-0126]|nr:major facilitator superfamily domain-containing protein [Leotiomycetes sp. MPI-SDFR-AT-0126]